MENLNVIESRYKPPWQIQLYWFESQWEWRFLFEPQALDHPLLQLTSARKQGYLLLLYVSFHGMSIDKDSYLKSSLFIGSEILINLCVEYNSQTVRLSRWFCSFRLSTCTWDRIKLQWCTIHFRFWNNLVCNDELIVDSELRHNSIIFLTGYRVQGFTQNKVFGTQNELEKHWNLWLITQMAQHGCAQWKSCFDLALCT